MNVVVPTATVSMIRGYPPRNLPINQKFHTYRLMFNCFISAQKMACSAIFCFNSRHKECGKLCKKVSTQEIKKKNCENYSNEIINRFIATDVPGA